MADDDDARSNGKPHEEFFEDKHLFGFTEGTDVGEAGSREAEFTTTGGFGKRGGGSYKSIRQEAAYEAAATDRLGYELIAIGGWHSVSQVLGLGNLDQANFTGLAVQPKYIFLRRGIDAPFGLAVSVEPGWERIDGVSGAAVRNFALETKLYLDTEFIPKTLLGAINIGYAPEWERDADGAGHSSLFSASAALSWRVTPDAFVGGEVQFQQAYRSLGFGASAGSAVYMGPTVHLQMGPRAFLALAWSTQIAASPYHLTSEGLDSWNQAELSRQIGRMVLGVEF